MSVYLDNSATTRPSEGVIKSMTKALSEGFYNPSSAYAPALKAEKELDACRDKILKAINAKNAKVIFTSGGTESNNLALFGATGAMRKPIKIAVSAGEHPSVYDAAERLGEDGAVETSVIPLDADGRVSLDGVRAALKGGLSLLSVMQVNNETGAINDIEAIRALIYEYCPSCRLHVDGVQGFLRENFDFNLCDMYAISAHKLHGPKGVGALVVKKDLRLRPAHIGGGQEEGLRSGTENTPGIIALSTAIDEMLLLSDRRKRLMEMKNELARALKDAVPAAIVNGPKPEDGACHILNVSFPGVRGETMLHALEERNVYVSTGSACSSKKTKLSRVLTEMGVSPKTAESAIRFSLSVQNTFEDISYAAEAVKLCYDMLVKYQRR